MGLSGVQRITKFVKYLPKYGWEPTVLTTEPAGYFAFDESLLEDLDHPAITIERAASLDPTRLFGSHNTVSLPAERSRTFLSNISQFVFIPDNKRGWKRPAIKAAEKLHREKPFQAVLATLPPYTCGLIAAELSARWKIPLTLDFRDDWLGNPRHVYPTPLHRKMHRRLEKRCFDAATSIVAINDPMAAALQSRLIEYQGPANSRAVSVIPQGFDPADFAGCESTRRDNKLRFLYTGVFYDVQTPDYFLRALTKVLASTPEAAEEIEARFVGLIPESSRQLFGALQLDNVVTTAGYTPHSDVVRELVEADVLWMTVGKGAGQETISTGKLFEYFGTRKPIMGFVPRGAAFEALRSYGASYICEPDDVEAIASNIEAVYRAWKNDQLPAPEDCVVQAYDRRRLTALLSDIL